MTVTLKAAREISPLIRFARWTALIAGVFYGHRRFNQLKEIEVDIQEHENAIKARNAVKLKARRERMIKEEMDKLGKDFGIEPKAS